MVSVAGKIQMIVVIEAGKGLGSVLNIADVGVKSWGACPDPLNWLEPINHDTGTVAYHLATEDDHLQCGWAQTYTSRTTPSGVVGGLDQARARPDPNDRDPCRPTHGFVAERGHPPTDTSEAGGATARPRAAVGCRRRPGDPACDAGRVAVTSRVSGHEGTTWGKC